MINTFRWHLGSKLWSTQSHHEALGSRRWFFSYVSGRRHICTHVRTAFMYNARGENMNLTRELLPQGVTQLWNLSSKNEKTNLDLNVENSAIWEQPWFKAPLDSLCAAASCDVLGLCCDGWSVLFEYSRWAKARCVPGLTRHCQHVQAQCGCWCGFFGLSYA